METLLKQAEELAGRPLEIEKTRFGKHVVLWMDLNQAPPKPGDSPEEAVKNFIEYIKERKTHGTDADAGSDDVAQPASS